MAVNRPIACFLILGLLLAYGCVEDSANNNADAGITITQCADAVDNENDGRIDQEDPGCLGEDGEYDPRDNDESDEAQCADLADNDGDGDIDLDDRGCDDASDDDEGDEVVRPECDDEVDNDGDGDIDLEDRGCASPADDDESDEQALPACDDGIDNDGDGLIDFPDDPGCASSFDSDEDNGDDRVRPQCMNGLDDDNDGLVDLADPGCSSVADPREQDPEESPQCSNGLDDDGDGVIDFPYEPGCSAAGDDDEADPDMAPLCGNDLDDDRDGLTDFPNDPGCAGIGDRDETDPSVQPFCSDGVDNDNDGSIDYPDDRGCESAADNTEGGACGRGYEVVEVEPGRVIRGNSRRGEYISEGSCGGRGAPEVVLVYRVTRSIEAFVVRTDLPENRLETTLYIRRGCLDGNSEIACVREPTDDGIAANSIRVDEPLRGDYYIFVDGAGGNGEDFEVIIDEVPLAACLNGEDDDEDGWTDYPLDPGCERRNDRDETDPLTPPLCFDGEDNDADGRTDFPLDVGCQSASDQDEFDVCGQGIRVSDYPVGEDFILDSTVDGGTAFSGTCAQSAGPEKIYVYENPFNARLVFSVDHPETIQRTLLYVRSSCVDGQSELGCDTGEGADSRGTVTLDRVGPGTYFVFVDHPFGLGGQIKLSVESERLPPGCSDGVDNDEDGFMDGDDPGCETPDDEDERDLFAADDLPICFDGLDNDEDGAVDYPFDPGCWSKGAMDETDPAELPVCANGLDDDEDGETDFPLDEGCSSMADQDEARARPAQCGNRIDDDQDGTVDYPVDPGCAAPGDLSETDDNPLPACADGEDNDRDGLVDYPFDPGCEAAGHVTEDDPNISASCSNGVDDDDDGITDFPLDPGCISAADADETDPGFPPQCANGRDDDQNGRSDFPDDPGCRFAGDSVERTDGPLSARCSDGVDNDLDGQVDLRDVGCLNSRDNDENDPEVAPLCADGEDNDVDGLTDWPEDLGCAAQGDECEQGGYGLCDGFCQDLQANRNHCGGCGRVCAPGVECANGRCGELRSRVLMCGTNPGLRGIQEFIRGELIEGGVIGQVGCEPAEDVQAILVTSLGTNTVTADAQRYLDYLEGGGQIITSRGNSHQLYTAIMGINAARPPGRLGSCRGNVQPVQQFSGDDPFWQENLFQAINAQQSGCGYPIDNIPDVVSLGGWSPGNTSLGYVDQGNGRMWFSEVAWYTVRAEFTDVSRDLMASMISGSTRTGLPPCLDGRDDDGDGLFDLEDPGCQGINDFEEGEAEGDEAPACADGIDNDGDGFIDYPEEPGCIAAGDIDEDDPLEGSPCANGLDDDGDGEPDYPFDPGCFGRGDPDERDALRSARCGNGRDDDSDGRTDYPADPGCTSAADPDEEDPAVPPTCANGLDDDRDGITDWPFDMGCASADGQSEENPVELPQCSNRLDDDEDGLTDFPTDPGCIAAGDVREVDAGEPPACLNGADDDEDGLTDYPADRGCRYAGDNDETDDFDPPAHCEDGVDNDGDALVDLSDPGCINADDDDEEDADEAPLCANEVDDDEDGLIDWPADPGCQAQGDEGEDQSCREEVEALVIPPNGTVNGSTIEGGVDNFRNRCGGREAPEQVYKYVLAEPAALLTFDATGEGTDFPVVLSVARDCEEPRSMMACAGDFRQPEPRISIENPEAGEYYVFVDGGGPEQWVSSGNPIQLPPDPQNFAANNDLRENCWGDGGRDAFDCYGRTSISFGGQAVELDVSPGADRQGNAGGYGFIYRSELVGNTWRLTMRPAVENDERRVAIAVAGNLGCDGGCQTQQVNTEFQGRQVRFMHHTDGVPRDPPITQLLLPGDPELLGEVVYAADRDNPTVNATITLPATFYVALSFADNAGVREGLLNDVEIRAGGGDPDAPRFGNFELSVTHE